MAHIKIKVNSTRHSDFVENRCEMCQTSPEVLPIITLWHRSVKTDLKFFIWFVCVVIKGELNWRSIMDPVNRPLLFIPQAQWQPELSTKFYNLSKSDMGNVLTLTLCVLRIDWAESFYKCQCKYNAIQIHVLHTQNILFIINA